MFINSRHLTKFLAPLIFPKQSIFSVSAVPGTLIILLSKRLHTHTCTHTNNTERHLVDKNWIKILLLDIPIHLKKSFWETDQRAELFELKADCFALMQSCTAANQLFYYVRLVHTHQLMIACLVFARPLWGSKYWRVVITNVFVPVVNSFSSYTLYRKSGLKPANFCIYILQIQEFYRKTKLI